MKRCLRTALLAVGLCVLFTTRGPALPGYGENTGPLLILVPVEVNPGDSAKVIGIGFSPSSERQFTLTLSDGTQFPVGTVSVGGDGRFNSFTVQLPPEALSGYFTIADGASNVKEKGAMVRGYIKARQPQISLDKEVGVAGDVVSVSGSGFVPGEDVRVFLNAVSGQPFATLKTDPFGALTAAGMSMPYGPAGNNTLIIVGDRSKMPITHNFLMIGFFPTVKLNTYSPRGDEVVDFQGMGFGPLETVRIHLNSLESPPVATAQTDAKGSFLREDGFAVPFGWQGKQAFLFYGEKSGATVIAGFEIGTYGPYLEPSTWSGRAGTTITFYGNNFARDETVHVFRAATELEPAKEASCFRTDANGTIAGGGSYTIQESDKPGKLDLVLIGSKSLVQVPISIDVIKVTSKLPVAGVPDNPGCQLPN